MSTLLSPTASVYHEKNMLCNLPNLTVQKYTVQSRVYLIHKVIKQRGSNYETVIGKVNNNNN